MIENSNKTNPFELQDLIKAAKNVQSKSKISSTNRLNRIDRLFKRLLIIRKRNHIHPILNTAIIPIPNKRTSQFQIDKPLSELLNQPVNQRFRLHHKQLHTGRTLHEETHIDYFGRFHLAKTRLTNLSRIDLNLFYTSDYILGYPVRYNIRADLYFGYSRPLSFDRLSQEVIIVVLKSPYL